MLNDLKVLNGPAVYRNGGKGGGMSGDKIRQLCSKIRQTTCLRG